MAPPKTASSDRRVPVGDFVVHALARHMQEYPTDRALRAVTRRDERLIFTNKADSPLSRTWFSSNVWRPAAGRAGIPDGLTFHDLRHFYASLLISRGSSVKVVQARLGHKSAVETLDTYGHLWPDDEDLTRQAVDAVLAMAENDLPGGSLSSEASSRTTPGVGGDTADDRLRGRLDR